MFAQLLLVAAFAAASATLETQTCIQQLKGYSWSCELNFQANGPCWKKIEREECARICNIPGSKQCSASEQSLSAKTTNSYACESCINYLPDALGEAKARDCVIFAGADECWSHESCRTTCGEACGVDKLCSEAFSVGTPAPTVSDRDELPRTDPPSSDGAFPNGSPCTGANECVDACVFEAGNGRCEDSSLFNALETPCTPGVTDCTCLVTASSAVCAVVKEGSNGIDPVTIGIIAGVSAAFFLLVGLVGIVLFKRKNKTPAAKVVSRDKGGKDIDVDVDVEKDSKVSSKGRSGGHVLNPQSSVTVL